MESTIYHRIKELCEEKDINIAILENKLGFGNSTIQKWKVSNPTIDKLIVVARYFNVSVDYLIGNTDIRGSAENLLNDADIISFQRAKENMTPQDQEKAMQMIKLAFSYAFGDDN